MVLIYSVPVRAYVRRPFRVTCFVRLRAETAKDRDVRAVPISSRLSAVLEMAKTDPAGREYPAIAYVFGLLGGPVQSVK